MTTVYVWMLVVNGYTKNETTDQLLLPSVYIIPIAAIPKSLKDTLSKYNGGKWQSQVLNYNRPPDYIDDGVDDEKDMDRRNDLCMFFHKYKMRKTGEDMSINIIIEKTLFYSF